ncbi:hypothetical protein MKX01_006521 [Papaver californicum]|nr:hypothetical protein MKX01_006521 [Papaver californicum]
MGGLVIIIMATIVSLLMIHCVATLHIVGGTRNNGWRPNFMNYTSDWASHEEFYVGDWLCEPYYFISGGGFCRHGMKLAVFVKELPPPPATKTLEKWGSNFA